jgi:hypothetical protein
MLQRGVLLPGAGRAGEVPGFRRRGHRGPISAPRGQLSKGKVLPFGAPTGRRSRLVSKGLGLKVKIRPWSHTSIFTNAFMLTYESNQESSEKK